MPHTRELCGDFRACLYHTVDIVYEQQDILLLFVTQIFRQGQSCVHRAASAHRVVAHLSERHRDLVEQIRLEHFIIEVTPLSASFAYAHEYRVRLQTLVYVMNQFLD